MHQSTRQCPNWKSFLSAMLFLPAFLCHSVPAATDLTSALPGNTLLALQIRDAPSFLAQWKSTPLARFSRDSRTASFFAPLRDQLTGLESRLQAKGLSREEAEKVLTGAALVAALPADAGAKQPFEWVLIFEHNGDPRVAALLAETSLPAGARIETTKQSIGEVQLNRVRVVREVQADIPNRSGSGQDRISTAPVPGIAVKRQTVREHQYALGPGIAMRKAGSGDELAAIARRLSGVENAVSGFRNRLEGEAIRRLAGVDPDIELFVNAAAIAKWYESNPKRLSLPLKGDPRALGLTDFKWIAAGMHLKDDRLAVQGALIAPKPHAGVGQLLDTLHGAPLDAAGLTPSNAVFYSSAAVQLDRGWDIALNLMARAAPLMRALLDVPLTSMQQSTGLTIRNDLLARLEPRIARFVLPGGSGPLTQSTWIMRIREPQPFAAALKALIHSGSQSLGMYQVTAEELSGATVYAVATGRPTTGYAGKTLVQIAQRGEWLLVSPTRDGIGLALERIASPGVESLKGEPFFGRAVGQLPEGRFSEAYADPTGLFPAAGDLFMTGWKIPGMDDWVKMTAAPGRAVWREFFGPIAASRIRRDDGIDFQAFILYAK